MARFIGLHGVGHGRMTASPREAKSVATTPGGTARDDSVRSRPPGQYTGERDGGRLGLAARGAGGATVALPMAPDRATPSTGATTICCRLRISGTIGEPLGRNATVAPPATMPATASNAPIRRA
ncbi:MULTISPECIES: hypothetical protein [unclassified Streptomyces]|uniref:hypothetical protein n=1 Tax=unclassified Streptomyces TaxID=2593676 RepID=UPI0022546BE8|nr:MULTISPECIES: hypothetical protein [unclassified Streptomyces]MCX5335662.1 hypothetical protein [Streptomyces sp. NBC_00140]MCX5366378.1 hypothetical protein [Streptomyces sp. NBC_00124]